MIGREHDRTQVRDEGDRRDWRHDGACRDVADAELFFPVAEDGPALWEQEARAKAVCAGCRVIEACRAWALESLPVGVAGGLTESERRALRQSRPAIRPAVPTADRPVRGGGVGRRERAAAVALVDQGRSAATVARLFGVTDRTVCRWVAADADYRTTPSTASVGGAR